MRRPRRSLVPGSGHSYIDTMAKNDVDTPFESLDERGQRLEGVAAPGTDLRPAAIAAVAAGISVAVAALAALFSGTIAERVAARPVLTAVLATGLLMMAVVAVVAIGAIHRIGERGEVLRLAAAELERRLREPLDSK